MAVAADEVNSGRGRSLEDARLIAEVVCDLLFNGLGLASGETSSPEHAAAWCGLLTRYYMQPDSPYPLIPEVHDSAMTVGYNKAALDHAIEWVGRFIDTHAHARSASEPSKEE